MSGERNRTDTRKKRVRFLKRLILLLTALAILIPIVLVFYLLIKVKVLEEQVSILQQTLQAGAEKTEETDDANVIKETEHFVEAEQTEAVAASQEDMNSVIESQKTRPIREIYLTFDDGPSKNTERILDILKKYQVKATFFVVGKEDDASILLYKRIVNEGHTLGMHSYSHDYNEIYASKENYIADLTRLKDYLYEVTGVRCQYVRFPGGSSNQVSKVEMKELIKYLAEEELVYYDWNLSSKDADQRNSKADTIQNNCLSQIEDYSKEVILLFHDGPDKEATAEALPGIIEGILKLEDTKLMAITQDTQPVQHVIAN